MKLAGFPILLRPCIFLEYSNAVLLPVILLVKGVSVKPGAIAFIRILFDAYVEAAEATKDEIAPFALEIASWFLRPTFEAALENKSRLPPLSFKNLKLDLMIPKQL